MEKIMENYTNQCAEAFLNQQSKLFDEPVAYTIEEAKEFLEECYAQVFDTIGEVRQYLEEEGMDVDALTDEELEEELEVFKVEDGQYLVVNG